MNTSSGRYLVCGTRSFRGHRPGAEFAARLDANAERRAVARGDLRVLERLIPSLQPGSYRLPDGWLKQQEEVQ